MTSNKKQAFWFLIVGASAALVHFTVLVACVQLGGIVPVWANVIAFFLAFIVSFAGHFHLTFSALVSTSTDTDTDTTVNNTSSDTIENYSTEKNWLKSLPKWFASSVGGFFLNQSLFIFGIYWLGDSWYALVWFVVTAVVTVMTFALGKLWAFK